MPNISGLAPGAALSRRRHGAHAALATAALLTWPAALLAAPLMYVETVMTGLANPRGLSFGPDGTLYVAEAGAGGNGPTIVAGNGVELGYGTTGRISRLQGGVQSAIATDLPSFALPSGEEAHGIQELAFGADGRLYATMGLGANPAELAKVAGQPNANLVGKIVAFDGSGAEIFADPAAFEVAEDPDGQGPDSNAYGLVAAGDGFWMTDAGGNSVVSVDATGALTVEGVLPNTPNPLFPFGPPEYQPVPTGAALGPDGALYFGQFTGFPFIEGAARIFRLDGGALSVVATGLTHVIDVAFGADGTLYALELDSDGLLAGGVTGSIFEIGLDGSTVRLFADLTRPTGFAISDAGDFYVSVNGFSPAEGEVVRLAPVPLPATLPALAAGLGLVAALRLRRGADRRAGTIG